MHGIDPLNIFQENSAFFSYALLIDYIVLFMFFLPDKSFYIIEEEILRNLLNNWNVFIVNRNAAPVSSTPRKHIRKLNINLSKSRCSRNSKPMFVLFYFANSCTQVERYDTYTAVNGDMR
jgi:hypothetical protein